MGDRMRDLIPTGDVYDIIELTPAHPHVATLCEQLHAILNDDSCFACEHAAYNVAPINVQRLVHDPGETVLVVLCGHTVCGGVSLSHGQPPLLHSFCVRESLRRMGIGRLLLEHVHRAHARTKLHLRPYQFEDAPSPARLVLNTRFSPLMRLYESCGYRVTDTSNPHLWVLHRDATALA
jgi:GNAT superfamily N-acetyltransferase